MRLIRQFTVLSALVLAGCGGGGDAPQEGAQPQTAGAALPPCDPDNGGITLPQGFCATVVADDVGEGLAARHLAVRSNGDIYVGVQNRRNAETPGDLGGIVGLRDTNGDGKVDERVRFGPDGGTGVHIDGDVLYFATNSAVLRYQLGEGLEPVSGPDTLVMGLPDSVSHTAKSLAVSPDGAIFVNIGSPTNACQPIGRDRQPGVMGEDPCTQLETRAGVWRFDANTLHQTQAQGERYATGIRNAVALEWNPNDNTPWAVQHGRDQLNLWPGFTPEENATRPAEELQRLTEGADFGWPYCFFDLESGRRVLSPEYGGDGQEVGRCASAQNPVATFGGHWAPNDLLFYTGEQFPQEYRNGAFIAFHGSWNRAPLPQEGYRVAFVPLQGGQAAGEARDFATGFPGVQPVQSPDQAQHRPVGLAQGPDGSLYISDSVGGRVWRVMYSGQGGGNVASR